MTERQKNLEEYRDQLENVSTNKILKLASKVRTQIGEMGLPLRKSANSLSIASGNERKSLIKLDKEGVFDINSRSLDEESRLESVRFIAYDRDIGVGKLDLIEQDLRRISYSVPIGVRTELRPLILNAINEDAVDASIRLFHDESGTITSVVVEDIESD